MANPFDQFDAKQANPFDQFDAGAKPDETGDFMRGAKVALGQTPAILKGAVGLVGATAEKAFGAGGIATGVKDWGLRGYQEGMQKLQPMQRETDDLTTAWDRAKGGDLGALVDWVQYGLGYAVGQAGEAAAVGILGGVAGAAAAPALAPAGAAGGAITGLVAEGAVKQTAKAMIEKAVVKEANSLMAAAAANGAKITSEQAVQQATKSVAREIGSTAALLGSGIGQELGSIYPEAEAEAAKKGEQLTGGDLARAWGAGVAAGGLEGLTDKLGLDVAFGKVKMPGMSTRAGSALAAGAGGALIEGGTEALQTGMERYGAGQELTGDEATRDYINSAGLGALGGAAIGGGSGALRWKAQEAVADKAMAEIGSATNVDEVIDAADRAVPPLDLSGIQPPDSSAAKAQREADRPEPATGDVLPGDMTGPGGAPFQTMSAAMVALRRAGPEFDLAPVSGGVVVRKREGNVDVGQDWGAEVGAREVQDAGVPSLDQREEQMSLAAEPELQAVRREGDLDSFGMGGRLPGLPSGGRPEAGAGLQPGPQEQRQGLRAGQSAMDDSSRAAEQPPKQSLLHHRQQDTDADGVVPSVGGGGRGSANPPQVDVDRRGGGSAAAPFEDGQGAVRRGDVDPVGTGRKVQSESGHALQQTAQGDTGREGARSRPGIQDWNSFPPESGTLSIPRAEMPQVKAEHRGALVNFLAARGITHEQEAEVDPTTLKATQAEYSPAKVQQARDYTGGNRAILVSSDGYVLDGHHQWLGAMSKGENVRVIRLNAPIRELMQQVQQFPSAEQAEGATSGAAGRTAGRPGADGAVRGDQPRGSVEPVRPVASDAGGRADRGSRSDVPGARANQARADGRTDDAVANAPAPREASATAGEAPAPVAAQTAAEANVPGAGGAELEARGLAERAGRNPEVVALRKRASVLKSLLECIG